MTCDKCNGTGVSPIVGYGQCPRCMGIGTALIGGSYAGIGSRVTPVAVAAEMANIAMQLALRGWMLRSGKAKRPYDAKDDTDSADLAFERGCSIVGGRKLIRVATLHQPALDHAAQYHPNWGACDEHAKALHGRNSLIMCGDWLDDPVRFVVCWTDGGAIKGGTGQALRIAAAMNIPVFNLAVTPIDALWSWLNAG